MQLSLADAGTLSPEAFAQQLATGGKVTDAAGQDGDHRRLPGLGRAHLDPAGATRRRS